MSMVALVSTVELLDGKGRASLKVRNSNSFFDSSTSCLNCSSKSAGASGNSSPFPSFLGLPLFGILWLCSSFFFYCWSFFILQFIGLLHLFSSCRNSPNQSTTKKYLAVEESTSFPFFKGPAVSRDKAPGVGHWNRRWGRHC